MPCALAPAVTALLLHDPTRTWRCPWSRCWPSSSCAVVSHCCFNLHFSGDVTRGASFLCLSSQKQNPEDWDPASRALRRSDFSLGWGGRAAGADRQGWTLAVPGGPRAGALERAAALPLSGPLTLNSRH